MQPPTRCARKRQDQDDEVALLERIRQRLGLVEPLHYRRLCIQLDQLVLRDVTPTMRREAHLLAANMKLAGLLNPPSVVTLPTAPDTHAANEMYEVFLGRRRVLAARELARDQQLPGWDQIWCHVYDVPADPVVARRMRALLTLSENGCRSPAWVEELRRLVEFLDHPVPLTDKELWTALGIPPSEAKARLKLARLPRPILEQVFAGELTSQALLHRIARLTHEQQAAVARRASAGEPIEAVLVDQALRGQIDAGLAIPVLQASLGQGWEIAEDEAKASLLPSTPLSGVGSSPGAPPLDRLQPTSGRQSARPVHLPGRGHSTTQSETLVGAVEMLRLLLPELAANPRLGQAALLAEALLHELEPEARRHDAVSFAA